MKKILVGMSGGVDSSVSALILKEKGYDVCGCTLRLHNNSYDSKCGSSSDTEDAVNVCNKLEIKHITLDFKDSFSEYVMTPFTDSYIKGETPNPCIECNKHMKFGLMLEHAEKMGFDCIATGHYADICYDDTIKRWMLKRPADRRKDQTYVLYTLTQYQLEHIIFPLYGLEKAKIREMAANNGLINSQKPDSQDICFIPNGDYSAFIKKHTGYIPENGEFISSDGEKIGTHSGIINYTIGQRRGLGVTFGKPVYVTDKDPVNNTVTLSENELIRYEITIRDVNLISRASITEPVCCYAKVRYNAREQEAVIYPPDNNGNHIIKFPSGVKNPAPGQACVFYEYDNNDIVMGGGVIIR